MRYSQSVPEEAATLVIDELTVHTPRKGPTPTSVRDLERVARAAFGGQGAAAAAVVEAAISILSCDTAVLLRPTARQGTLAATHLSGEAEPAAHEPWQLGSRAPELFERASHTADGWREPWASLRMKLQAVNVGPWAAVPLRREGRFRSLGLLVVGARDAADRPGDRLDQLDKLALSATAALSAAEEIDGANLPAPDAVHNLRMSGNLAFGVSHTLGNIFGAIIGNLHFLREETARGSARELIDRIERSTTDGMELMRSLQTYTAISGEAGMRSLDLSESAGEVTTLARRLTGHWPGHRGVRIEETLTSTAPAWGDLRQVRESLVNLVFNAVQAVGREGRVMVRTGCDERFSEVRVIDDGPGMTDEVRRRAAEPFFTTRPRIHQGLGLTVARAVAVGHRGALTLHHAPTRGMEVAFRLPQGPPDDQLQEPQGNRRFAGAINGTRSATAGH